MTGFGPTGSFGIQDSCSSVKSELLVRMSYCGTWPWMKIKDQK